MLINTANRHYEKKTTQKVKSGCLCQHSEVGDRLPAAADMNMELDSGEDRLQCADALLFSIETCQYSF